MLGNYLGEEEDHSDLCIFFVLGCPVLKAFCIGIYVVTRELLLHSGTNNISNVEAESTVIKV